MNEPTVPADARMPALYIGHGAPPLLDDPVWGGELAAWARDLPRPRGILVVSAHWESAPLAISAPEAGLPWSTTSAASTRSTTARPTRPRAPRRWPTGSPR